MINRKDMLRALLGMKKVCPGKAEWARLEGFHLVRLRVKSGKYFITATDGVSWATSVVLSDEDSSFEVAVPLHDLFDAVESSDKENVLIERIESADGDVGVIVDKNFVIQADDDDDVGEFPNPENEGKWNKLIEIPLKGYLSDLRWMITAGFRKTDERRKSKPSLYQAQFDKNHAVVTDGERLHMIKGIDIKRPIRVDLDILRLLVGVFKASDTIKVYLNGNRLLFRGGTWSIETEQPSHKFPDYKTVIPTGERQELVVKRKDLIDLTNHKAGYIGFTLGDDLVVTTHMDSSCTEILTKEGVEIIASREKVHGFSIHFNGALFTQALRIGGKNVKLSFDVDPEGGKRKVCVVDSGEGRCALVMPLVL